MRKGGVSAEWTQELQAVDAIDVVDPSQAGAPKVSLPRRKTASASSIAPVGLDLPTRDLDDEVSVSLVVRPAKRRRLGGIVVGAVAGCTLILVAAGVARAVRASEPGGAAGTAAAATEGAPAMTGQAGLSAATTLATTTTTTPANPSAAKPATATASLEGASTGTVRLDGAAKPGRVWLDGQKLLSSSALVSCGTHQLKVGRHRTHSIDVPCGGELAVTK